MSPDAEDSSDYIGPGILDITLKSDKPFKHAEVNVLTAGGYTVCHEERTPNSPEVTFRMPKEQPLCPGMVVRVAYSQTFAVKDTIDISGDDLRSAYTPGGGNKQAWQKSCGNVELLLDLEDPYRPTTERILEVCPQFRILVMGKAGVGKSSLINQVFGITEALVSDGDPGDADINREFTSKKNPQLVLHDSRGLEPGENVNFQVVQDFIKLRGKEREIGRKLHAIWLCMKAPHSGSRTMEIGDEQFLKLKKDGELGDVPIIVVFTKYDLVISAERWENSKAGRKLTLEEVTKKTNDKLKQECFIPFEAAVGKDIPYLLVSVKPSYVDTLNELIRITYENVTKYDADAAIVNGISQRINAQVKVRTCIEVGKRRHWKELSSRKDSRMTLEMYLKIVHEDIVKVWNMEDKDNLLCCDEFRNLMLRLTGAPEKPVTEKINTAHKSAGRNAVKSIATVLSGAAGPIVMVVGVPTLDWINGRFSKTPANLRRSMIYIVDLTIVMQNLFWIRNMVAPKPRKDSTETRVTIPTQRRFIKLALNLYTGTPDRELLLEQINRHKRDLYIEGVVDAKLHKTVDKVIDLIKDFTISDQDAFAEKNNAKIDKSWENVEDVPWDTPVA